MDNNIYKDITKVFSSDAEFGFRNGMKHYEDRIRYEEIPKTMTYQQYFSKSKEVSLKRIDGKNVRAYRYKGDRIGKSDGKWFVSYAGGIGGTIITSFPLRNGWERFEYLLKRDEGREIIKK